MMAPVKKDLRGVNKELVDAVKALDETIARHLTRAERENATVYLQVHSTSGYATRNPAQKMSTCC